MSKDPLDVQGSEREVFDSVWRMLIGQPRQLVLGIAMNLIVNVIRQSVAKRRDAEAVFDELIGKGKSTLLDVHYDSVTGVRRSVFPFTQVAQAPFHDEGNVVFHGK